VWGCLEGHQSVPNALATETCTSARCCWGAVIVMCLGDGWQRKSVKSVAEALQASVAGARGAQSQRRLSILSLLVLLADAGPAGAYTDWHVDMGGSAGKRTRQQHHRQRRCRQPSMQLAVHVLLLLLAQTWPGRPCTARPCTPAACFYLVFSTSMAL
jgi:hypothetical protein